jgi:adenylosuccinate lyase
MLALSRRIGKQTAHRMVHRLVASARLDGLSFSKAIARDRDICRLLSQEEIDLLLSVDAQIGQCRVLVDRVLELGSGRRAP